MNNGDYTHKYQQWLRIVNEIFHSFFWNRETRVTIGKTTIGSWVDVLAKVAHF